MSGTSIRCLLSLLCNAAIVALTAISVLGMLFQRKEGEPKRANPDTFCYFTTDSNVLAALAALLMLPFAARGLFDGTFALPLWVTLIKYVGTVAVSVTFLTVIFFLGPTQGYRDMFAGGGLHLHLICPLLAIVSFCLLETGTKLSWAQALLGLLPTFIYGTVYLWRAVFVGKEKGGWDDFYGFNVGGRWAISYVAMHMGTFAICVGVRALHNLF